MKKRCVCFLCVSIDLAKRPEVDVSLSGAISACAYRADTH